MKRNKLIIISLIIFISLFFSFSVNALSTNVLIVEINDTINQSTVELLTESINEAEYRKSQALILLLNTPGGGLQQTFDIAAIIKNSKIPIVGYVYPSGSTAWSAGTFILMSTHIAAMANNTVIGSCQPVEISFEGTRTINDSKTINALVKWIQERADMYGRNITIAKEFIIDNRNVNASIAKKHGAIEYISESIDDLLKKIDKNIVETSSGNISISTKSAEKIYFSPSYKIIFLKLLSNPILTSLLLILGIFSLIFGISSPGFGAEVFGIIAILLSLFGSGFIISEFSIIFIILGFLLLIIEIFVTPGFGVVGIGGIICLFVGSIFLIPTFSTREWMITMDWINNLIIILIVSAILISLFFGFLLYKIIEIRNKKKVVGVFEGEIATSTEKITPNKPGYIKFKGEYWKAKSNLYIEPDTKVVIIKKDDFYLIVKPVK
jgi:membrane-bound serine protease (ClpP class)